MPAVKCQGLIDGQGGFTEKALVRLEGDRFGNILKWGEEASLDPEDSILDYSSFFMTPGLIDTHVHLAFTGREKTMDEPAGTREWRLLQGAVNAFRNLLAGVTTVADCGGLNGLAFHLRDASKKGLITGPRILACGRPITITGGHGYAMSLEADDLFETRKAARTVMKDGADFIKIMATGGSEVPLVMEEGRWNWNHLPAYRVEEITPVVEEAHRLNRKVVAHCLAAEGVLNAVTAGVDIIAHAAFIQPDGVPGPDRETIRLMVEKGTTVVPTLSVFSRDVEGLEIRKSVTRQERARLDAFSARLEIAAELARAGVRVAAGTDAGFSGSYHGDMPRELRLLVRAGMAPLDAIQTATGNAAGCLGVGHLIGTVEPGKRADFLILREDPRTNIRTFETPCAVFLDGREVDGGPSFLRTKGRFAPEPQ